VIYLKVIQGSISQAIQQLLGNRLRSFLSLLGISIGVFCVIGVKSAIDSLEDSIKGSLKQIGDNTLFLSKVPFDEDPHENFFKYQRRPQPSINDLYAIKDGVPSASRAALSVFLGPKILKHKGASVENCIALGVTFDFAEMKKFAFTSGRFFTFNEYEQGTSVAVIGASVAEQLFGATDPIGKEILAFGQKMIVIGVLPHAGRSLIDTSYDECIMISYETARKVANVKPKFGPFSTSLTIEAAEGASMQQLKDEVTGVLRSTRRLRPRDSDNFSLNELSFLTKILDNVFGALSLVGFLIGGFALIVGLFSVANIMFVSVKERTNIIGIKKALGAKRFVILLEFLIESIILCIIGGLVGLFFIALAGAILTEFLPFDVVLSPKNAINGVLVSIFTGIFAGMIPAVQASKMDPVEAMRQ
jgi:putative ABC transport system permease protein